MENELGTVNVCFKRSRKSVYYYRKAELVRPKKINAALNYLQDKHPSYQKLDIQKLNDDHKYMFINLPLIGYFEEDQKDLKTLNDAYDFLRKSSLLVELLSPLHARGEQHYQNFMEKLVQNESPQNQDSFLHALVDQIR